jgi:thiamine biosynthesis lipoprotein
MKISRYFLFIAVVILSFSCDSGNMKVTFQGQTQGTYYAITYYDKAGRDFQAEVDSILKAFDLSVSMWVPSSIISQINSGDTNARPDDWFLDILNRSVELSERTEGAFDFTVGPLVNAWGFGFKGKMKMDSLIVDSLLQFVDFRQVSISENNRIMMPVGFRIDFNAIAQGYAVDMLGKFLENSGIENYLVDIGGEVYGRGWKPGKNPWLVGIENPAADSLSERTYDTKVRITNQALATSGNYRKYYEENGIRYSHTIDPKTGFPVRHSLLSVSVLADNCATADGFATAFMVMGLEKAMEFVEEEPGIEAFFIVSDDDGSFKTYISEGFETIIVE